MHSGERFRKQLRDDIEAFLRRQSRRFPAGETLSIDLHCHDKNSDVPDELVGRILRLPETWIPTEKVVEALKRSGTSAITITNHNNARSCWDLLERGHDILVGAEFTCTVPDYDVHLHVLGYGFDPAQEQRLLRLRKNIYRFLEYTCQEDIPTILAHPLFFYFGGKVPPVELLEKLTVMFDNFEALNGQRDSWQNLLVASWIESLTAERIDELGRKVGISPRTFCRRPYDKALSGGSDCHMGLFVGTTGTQVHVPDLARRLLSERRADLVLDALRRGAFAPFGSYACQEKLTASLLDFFCQAALNMEDPGLVRMLLHRGSMQDKLTSLVIANGMLELRRHRFTLRFLKAFHESLHGKRPGFMLRRMIAKPLRPVVRELDAIAVTGRSAGSGDALQRRLETSIQQLFRHFSQLLADRVDDKFRQHATGESTEPPQLSSLVEKLEIPSQLRALFGAGRSGEETWSGMSAINLPELTDGLPFPFLAASLIGGISFASCKAMFNSRPLAQQLAGALGNYEHPKRALWLTDTLFDRNGVGSTLHLLHEEAKRRDLPLDVAVCGDGIAPDEHLVVLEPLAAYTLPFYPQQPLRVFDLLQLQRIFIEGGYDRVVCSTEGLAGLAGLYLKHAFNVPAYFYLHTDWLDFASRTLRFDRRNVDRVRRLLRAFYSSFDGLFVLNSDQEEWLASDAMSIPPARLHRTAHWVSEAFRPRPVDRERALPGIGSDEPVVLYVGRVSAEKGVLELPALMSRVRREVPRARLVVAGTGPAEARLQEAVPDAVFLQWLDTERLSSVYAAADVLVLPSRFDTFGCVVLEALSCGLPAVAYATKGPKDIIVSGQCGYAVVNRVELADRCVQLLTDHALRQRLSRGALERAAEYRPREILNSLMVRLGLGGAAPHLDDAAPLFAAARLKQAASSAAGRGR